MIVPYLANLFHVALSEKRIPACYKNGFKLDPNNYRITAVSGTLYRLYANILRELVTKWCAENRKVPDTQFGFYPDRSTIQPMFISMHLVYAAKQIKLSDRPFSKAAHMRSTDLKTVFNAPPKP